MKENFIHFIWQYQYFNSNNLQTTEGEAVQVLQQGMYNRQDAGPDFARAKLRIGDVLWHGDVEIHLRATDWNRHNHQCDMAYNRVVLHVVWEDDGRIQRQDGSMLPQLELKERVGIEMIHQYEQLMESMHFIPCAPQFKEVSAVHTVSMLDKTLLERLRRKSDVLLQWLDLSGGDWETVAWWLLAQNFGFKKNNEAFLRLAQNLPVQLLGKHRQQPLQQEALLFGLAGFLPAEEDDEAEYVNLLVKEWKFLGHKYQLSSRQMQTSEWKFLRMRPANFPTIRLAQLAALVHKHHHLFSLFRDELDTSQLVQTLRQPLTGYWQKHYHIGRPSKGKMAPLGIGSAQNLLINTAAPLLAAFGIYTDEESWLEQAMDLLQKLPAEENQVMREWERIGLLPENAYDSQALLELFKEFCQPKRCLQCTIGLSLLKRENT